MATGPAGYDGFSRQRGFSGGGGGAWESFMLRQSDIETGPTSHTSHGVLSTQLATVQIGATQLVQPTPQEQGWAGSSSVKPLSHMTGGTVVVGTVVPSVGSGVGATVGGAVGGGVGLSVGAAVREHQSP